MKDREFYEVRKPILFPIITLIGRNLSGLVIPRRRKGRLGFMRVGILPNSGIKIKLLIQKGFLMMN